MFDPKPRHFQRPPHFAPAWLRAIFAAHKRPRGVPVVPRLAMTLGPQTTDSARLSAYRALCGFAGTATLPPTWPQVVAGALHLQMLTDPKFPLPSMGVVHLRNHIEQTRPLSPSDVLEYACHLEPARATAKGLEIDIVTHALCQGEVVWKCVITVLSRVGQSAVRSAESRSPPPPSEEAGEVLTSRLLQVPADMGRRYARVAGDFNPIHQHALLARPFGFRTAIVHGMWSLAQCVAACEPHLPPAPLAIDVAFKRPVELPSRVQMTVRRRGDGLAFALTSRGDVVVHLVGSVARI